MLVESKEDIMNFGFFLLCDRNNVKMRQKHYGIGVVYEEERKHGQDFNTPLQKYCLLKISASKLD